MSPKHISFLAYCFFTSTLIAMVIDGGYFTATETSVFNDLAAIQQLGVGGLIGIPAALLTFTRGLFRMLIWDYTNIYYGSYEIIRWFFVGVFSSGAVWGITSTFAPVFANLLRFR